MNEKKISFLTDITQNRNKNEKIKSLFEIQFFDTTKNRNRNKNKTRSL
jgi:hypothetical protein